MAASSLFHSFLLLKMVCILCLKTHNSPFTNIQHSTATRNPILKNGKTYLPSNALSITSINIKQNMQKIVRNVIHQHFTKYAVEKLVEVVIIHLPKSAYHKNIALLGMISMQQNVKFSS